MADTKITGLISPQVTTNPATDVLPIVNIADTLMASSGSTRKITVNQLLGAGGTATLASATITGDLTVDTSTLKVDSSNDRVGIGTATPAAKLIVRDGTNRNLLVSSDATQLGSAGIAIGGFTDNAAGYAPLSLIASAMQFGIGGSTAMTLNSTGLGVGAATPDFKFVVNGTQAVPSTSGSSATDGSLRIGAPGTGLVIDTGVTAASAVYGWIQARARTDYSSNFNLVLQPNGGNVGVGVAPSAVTGQTRVELKGSNGAGYVLRSASTNASARDWVIAANVSAFGDFVIRQGNSQGAEPNSGTDRFYIDPSGNTIFTISSTPPTLSANSQLTVNATSNTNLRFSYRGSDGTTRVANITLA